MSFQIKSNRFARVSATGLICGLLVLTLPLGGCVSSNVLLKQESGYSKLAPLVVVVENEDRLGMKGRLEHLLLSQGFNVVSDLGEHKRLVVTEELPATAVVEPGKDVQQVKRMTTDLQNRYPVNYAFRFGYQTDQQGDVIKLTGSIVDLRSGEFVFSYEFQDGLVTPFNTYILGEELAKTFPDGKPRQVEDGVGAIHSDAHGNTSAVTPTETSGTPGGSEEKGVAAPAKDSSARKDVKSGKVELVKEIAWQTNLLALNTSVEASRHATPGDPMVAVAAEIKNLADRSMLGVLELGTLMHTPLAAEYRAEELLAQLTPELETATSHLLFAQGKNPGGAGGVAGAKGSAGKGVAQAGQPEQGQNRMGEFAMAPAYPVPTPNPRRWDAGGVPTQLAMVAPVPQPKPKAMTTP
ncbi:MAG: hypothetical protein HQL63_08580 [Magnetococcales bacterium]|nr:hypothetical protein [Magnetococcales bacterium]